jgi:hypothetical protein
MSTVEAWSGLRRASARALFVARPDVGWPIVAGIAASTMALVAEMTAGADADTAGAGVVGGAE